MEKGVRGKGRQPLSPPSAGETRGAVTLRFAVDWINQLCGVLRVLSENTRQPPRLPFFLRLKAFRSSPRRQ